VDIEEFLRWLVERGFHATSAVELPGEFSHRGGILDIFAPDWLLPVRVELFDDEIESLRTFEVGTQRSHDTLDEIDVTVLRSEAFSNVTATAESVGHLSDYFPPNSSILLVDPDRITDEGRNYLQRVDKPGDFHSVQAVLAECSRFAVATTAEIEANTAGVHCHLPFESVERFSGDVGRIRDEFHFGTRAPGDGSVRRLSYQAASTDQPRARLAVRSRESDRRTEIARGEWEFIDDRSIRLVPEGRKFEPVKIYELWYEATGAKVLGIGYASVRDLVSFLRYERDGNPILADGGEVRHALGFGVSQSGRFLRHFLELGMNTDDGGRPVFDGVLSHVAGAGKVFANHRFGMPGLTATQHEDRLFPENWFPFSMALSADPVSGRTDGDSAAILDAPSVGRLRRDALDRAFEREFSELAHEAIEEVAGIASAAELRHVRARVGRADMNRRMIENLRDNIQVGVNGVVDLELSPKVVGQRDIEHGRRDRLTFGLCDVSYPQALILKVRRVVGLANYRRAK
jgi:hypothetical protein